MGHAERRDRRMQLRARRACDTMHRPGIDKIRMVRPVAAGFDMPVLRRRYERIPAAVALDKTTDAFGDRVAALNGEFAALRECWLYVDDDQCCVVRSHVHIL